MKSDQSTRRSPGSIRGRAAKALLGAAAATMLLVLPARARANTITADGLFDVGQYQLGYSVGMLDGNNNLIGNASLYFGLDNSGNEFLYFQMPTTFVDNTYGTNASAGWGGPNHHKFSDLLNSDALGAHNSFGWNGNKVSIDYLACVPALPPNKGCASYRSGGIGTTVPSLEDGATNNNDGSVGTLGPNNGGLEQIATSLEYNMLNVDPTATVNSSTNPNWIIPVAYELEFAPNTFNPSDWLNPADAAGLITLGTPHVSPSMQKFGSYQTPVCTVGCSPQPPPVPEPSTLLLFGSGLLGVAGSMRRRRGGRKTPASR